MWFIIFFGHKNRFIFLFYNELKTLIYDLKLFCTKYLQFYYCSEQHAIGNCQKICGYQYQKMQTGILSTRYKNIHLGDGKFKEPE